MAYIKQNWSEMQSNEIPLEAQHLEHIEEGIIDVDSRIGDVLTKDNIEWQDLEINATSMGYFFDTVDKFALEENKSYKVIITDAQDTEAAYDLTLIDAGLIIESLAGYKILYHGDAHTGGNNMFLLSQDSYFDISKGNLIPAEGATGIALVGYKKAVIKEFSSTIRTENTITGLSQNYIEAAQTDFLCEDPTNIKYLKNRPFGKTTQTKSFMDFECKATSDEYLRLDYKIDLKPGCSYVAVFPDPYNPNTIADTEQLLYYTIKDYLIAVGNSSLLGSLPEEAYNIEILVTSDLRTIVIACGGNPATLTLEPGTFYINQQDVALLCPGYSYRIEGINQTIDVYKKLSSEYVESPDFEESNTNLGTYIKNLPLGINLTIKNLVDIPELICSSNWFSFESSLTPLIGKNYTVYVNDIAYPATCSAISILGMPARLLTGVFGLMYCLDKQDLIDGGYPVEQSLEEHGRYAGQFSSNLPGHTSNWTVSLRIEGPLATYRKLSSEYTPSINVSASDKNKLKTTKINGDYYLSLLSNDKNAGAISLTRDFSKLNLSSNNITNFVDTATEEIINISNEPSDFDKDFISGSLLLSSEANDSDSLENFKNCGPILTALKDSYIYVIPSIPKVFKLDANGISVFADLSNYEATWREYFSKVRGYIKLVYHGSTGYGADKYIKIISRTNTTNLTLRISTSANTDLYDAFETDETFCTIYESNLEVLSSGSDYIHVDLYDFGPVNFTNGYYSSRILNTSNVSLGSGSTSLQAYSGTIGSRPLISENTYMRNLCTATKFVYRYLDENDVEHFRYGYIDSNDNIGQSNSRHSNYFYCGKSVKELPGFSNSSYPSYGDYLTYTSDSEILVRSSSGAILDSRKVTNGPGVDSYTTSQTFLFLVNDFYLLISEHLYIYKIYEDNGELKARNIGRVEGSLVAQPMVIGNYLMIPTNTRISTDNYPVSDLNIQCRFIKYIPLYKTIEQKVDSMTSKLSTAIKDIQNNTSEVANKSVVSKITGLSSSLEIPTAKAVFDLVYPNVSKDWSHIQEVIRAGLGPTIYPVGYEFTTWDSINKQNITWVVVGHNQYKVIDEKLKYTMTLESKYVLSDQTGCGIKMNFSGKPRTFYYAREGLPAGNYYIRTDSGYYAQYFTIPADIPAGGCLKLAPNTSFKTDTATKDVIYACNSLNDTGTEIEYSTSYLGYSGEVKLDSSYKSLGDLSRRSNLDLESNIIEENLFSGGSNNYAHSAINQWLNSAEDSGNWWTHQTVFDEAPNNGLDLPGFLQNLPEDFKNVVQPISLPCSVSYSGSVDSLDGTQFNAYDKYNLITKFFLPSRTELNFYTANTDIEGIPFEYYQENTNTSIPKYDLLNIKGTPWTRTSTSSCSVGSFNGNWRTAATHAGEIVPACVIA